MTPRPALRSPLAVLASATATHATGSADDVALPRLPGFVESAFSPLVYEVSRRCLIEKPVDGTRTAVALASLAGDTTTADLASSRMVSGKVHNPLLFMQATANSVLGHISREFGITGQMFSVSTLDDPVTESLLMADLLLEDTELDHVLVVGVELGGGPRVAALHQEAADADARPLPRLPASAGLASAVLLGRPGPDGVTVRSAAVPRDGMSGPYLAPAARHHGSVQGLVELAAAHRWLLREGGDHLLVTEAGPGRGRAAFMLTGSASTSLPAPTRDEKGNHAHR
ncbi:beta-ketoacyl synthase N-terminal-like domain-containing protein [Streptomyces sp. NPDC004539]|uniref:beta-ketoacyl synthase N-terminal-like domain-containing protein n=1 Tax=Streptomyces sp. NPDC004539 TaxID=3154280 RepID=UPI0033A75A27